jgi:hypothetical protein
VKEEEDNNETPLDEIDEGETEPEEETQPEEETEPEENFDGELFYDIV